MRVFLQEKGLIYELDFKDTLVGLVYTVDEMKYLRKIMKGYIRRKHPFVNGIFPMNCDKNIMTAFLSSVIEKVIGQRPDPNIVMDSIVTPQYKKGN
jgi:hypothetical protein